jgi:hypothetical protein
MEAAPADTQAQESSLRRWMDIIIIVSICAHRAVRACCARIRNIREWMKNAVNVDICAHRAVRACCSTFGTSTRSTTQRAWNRKWLSPSSNRTLLTSSSRRRTSSCTTRLWQARHFRRACAAPLFRGFPPAQPFTHLTRFCLAPYPACCACIQKIDPFFQPAQPELDHSVPNVGTE